MSDYVDQSNEDVLDFFGGDFWVLSKNAVQAFGIERALWITNILSWRRKLSKEGNLREDKFFYISQLAIEEHTTLSPDKQTAFIKYFEELGVLKVDRGGKDNRNHYFVNFSEIARLSNEMEKNNSGNGGSRKTKERVPVKSGSYKNKELEEREKNCSNSLCSDEHTADSVPVMEGSKQIPRIKISRSPLDVFSPNSRTIFDHWNSMGKPLSCHKIDPNNKTLLRANQEINKLIDRGQTTEEIKLSITNYHWLLSLGGTKLNTSHRGVIVPLPDFLKFNRELLGHIRANGDKHLKDLTSWFEECLQTQDALEQKWSVLAKDEYPILTKRLRILVDENVGINKLSVGDENILRRSAKKLYNYFENLEDVRFQYLHDTWEAKMDYVFECLDRNNIDLSKKGLRFLLFDSLYNELLPTFWWDKGMVIESYGPETLEDADEEDKIAKAIAEVKREPTPEEVAMFKPEPELRRSFPADFIPKGMMRDYATGQLVPATERESWRSRRVIAMTQELE